MGDASFLMWQSPRPGQEQNVAEEADIVSIRRPLWHEGCANANRNRPVRLARNPLHASGDQRRIPSAASQGPKPQQHEPLPCHPNPLPETLGRSAAAPHRASPFKCNGLRRALASTNVFCQDGAGAARHGPHHQRDSRDIRCACGTPACGKARHSWLQTVYATSSQQCALLLA